MGYQFTNAIREGRAEGGAATQAGELPAINRAAWPSGPLLARAVVSDRSGPGVIYDPVIESKPRLQADAVARIRAAEITPR